MYKRNIPYIEALKFIQNRREIVNPNKGFRKQLCDFEKYLETKRKLLNKTNLDISDLDDFEIKQVNREKSMMTIFDDKEEDIDYLIKEFKRCCEEYFFSLIYDDVYYFLQKYGSMIMNQFPQLFGIVIEDILLNASNSHRQLFILLMVELFKSKQIHNNNNNFVQKVFCGSLARNFHDDLIDSPYFLQFLSSLFAHIIDAKYVLPECIALFCETSMKFQNEKILSEQMYSKEPLNKKIIESQYELIKFQCSKIILYCLKELELLESVDILSKFKYINFTPVLIENAFEANDQHYLSYLAYTQ